MRPGSFSASVTVHGVVALMLLWEGGTSASRPQESPVPKRIRLFVPPKGAERRPPQTANKSRGTRNPPARPGSSVDLEGVQLVIHDRWISDLPATLKRWHGRITDCPTLEPGAYRFWLYDPPPMPGAGTLEGIPCADFPAAFERALTFRIANEAARRGFGWPVEKAVIGFSKTAADGLLVLSIRR